MEDVMLLLHDGRVSGQVVECWAKLLLDIYKEKASSKRTLVFSPNSWDCVHMFGKSKEKLKWLYDTIDARIENEVAENHILLFPMVTKGEGRFPLVDHWTMLMLDLGECEWKFYNSLEPRTKNLQDVHLTRSFLLHDYVEKKLKEVFKTKHPSHPFLKAAQHNAIQADCPQQSAGTLDCATI